MKRRGFLSLLGLAPAAPLVAKEMLKAVDPPTTPLPSTLKPREQVHYASADEFESSGSFEYWATCSYTMQVRDRR